MTRTLTCLVALLVISPVFAQKKNPVIGSGKIITETRAMTEFDAIELRIAGDAHVTIGKPTPLEITGDDNILPLIKTEVVERRLVISAQRRFKTESALNLKVTVADLTAAAVAGSGDMHISGVENKSMALAVKGSGDLRFEGKSEKLTASVAGSGDVQLTGKANTLVATVSGSGDIHGFDLPAVSATVTVKGSGDARVNVTKALTVQVKGSGDVHYKGNPTVVQQISGTGDVKRCD
jgi:hypothetical protein